MKKDKIDFMGWACLFTLVGVILAFGGQGIYKDIQQTAERKKQTMTAQERAEEAQVRKAQQAEREAIAKTQFHPQLPPGWKLMKDGNGKYMLKKYDPNANHPYDGAWNYWSRQDAGRERSPYIPDARRFNCAKQAITALNDYLRVKAEERATEQRMREEIEVTE